MIFSDYLRIARRWWWVVFATCIAASAAAYLLTERMTPVYSAQATILVNQAQNPGAQTYQDILGSQQLTKTYAELAVSVNNLERALQRLSAEGLDLDKLQASVSARAVRETQLIRIVAEDTIPTRAALTANTVAALFPSYVEEAQLAGQSEAAGKPLNTVFVAETAQIPKVPVRPNTTVNISLGLMLGLLLGVALVAVLEYRDDAVGSREDIQAAGAPFLGSVMKATPPKGENRHEWLPSLIRNPDDRSLVESYRAVQANLAFALGATDGKVLLVTSSSPGEGKSTTAANLADALAGSGKRVLLIDADMRKPDAHRYFGIPNNAGLSTAYLADLRILPTLVRKVSETFFLLTGGPTPPNPAELLGSGKTQAILATLTQPFDIVIIDSPPILGLADASLLATYVDGIVLVARQGKTRRNHLRETVEIAHASQKPLVGVILNGDRRTGLAGYYHYGYGQDQRQTRGRFSWAPWLRRRPAVNRW